VTLADTSDRGGPVSFSNSSGVTTPRSMRIFRVEAKVCHPGQCSGEGRGRREIIFVRVLRIRSWRRSAGVVNVRGLAELRRLIQQNKV
jgi:hypothetical protein